MTDLLDYTPSNHMITWLVEYIDPLFEEPQISYSEGEDKTAARDLFYGSNPDVERIVKISRLYTFEA